MNEHDETNMQGQWDRGWKEHKSRQLARLARLSLAEKLEWLEEAQELGERLIAQAKRIKKTKRAG